MEIYYNRNGSGMHEDDISTIGVLTVGSESCLILEDDYDPVKEYGHTRIPAGRYRLKLRTEGRLHEKYNIRFPQMHKGMIWLQDVPDYKHIYIHCGVMAEDTLGCLLTGSIKINENLISGSSTAYKRIYPIIAEAIEKEETYINITD